MLRFGTAGIPFSAKGKGTEEGIREVKKLGLDAMELEFVHSVNIKEENTEKVRKAAQENDVGLTCHGQYYINLNATERAKLEASKQRLLKAAHIAWKCGAKSVAFHPGYYMKMEKEEVYKNVRNAIREVVGKLKQQGNGICIAPETTGKHTQFGNLKEVIRLSQELEQVKPCIDYAHLRAREGVNDRERFAEVLQEIEKGLGKKALKDMHIQFSGVNFSDKGELNHMTLEDSDMNYMEMAKSWKEFGVEGVAISESPNIEKDAMLLKGIYNG